MPTSPDNDEQKLSRLLNEIEPPKSPQHLDERITRHARTEAENRRRDRLDSTSVLNHWFGQNWRSAIAVFSVSAIAISLSLQLFNQPLESPRTTAIELADSADLGRSLAPTEAVAEEEAEEITVSGNFIRADAIELRAEPEEDNVAGLRENLELARQASGVSAPQPENLAASAADDDQIAQLQAGADDRQISVDAVSPAPASSRTSTAARSASPAVAAPIQSNSAGADLLPAEPADQINNPQFQARLITLLGSALTTSTQEQASGLFDSTTDQNQSTLENLRTQLLTNYDGLEENAIATANENYRRLQTQTSDIRLPETLQEALDLVREMNF